MVGVPVAGLSTLTNASFALDYGYLTLDCPSIWNGDPNDPELLQRLGYVWGPNGLAWNEYPTATTEGLSTLVFTTASRDWAPFFLDTNTEYSMARYNTASNAPNLLPDRNLVFGSVRNNLYGNDGYWTSVRNCTVENRYVEAIIEYNGLACSTKTLRPSSTYLQLNLAMTMLDIKTIFGNLAFKLLLTFATYATRGAPSATELFIEGVDPYGDSLLLANTSGSDILVIANLSSETFSRRLGIVLNTFLNLTSTLNAFIGDLLDLSSSVWGPYGNRTLDVTAGLSVDVESPFTA